MGCPKHTNANYLHVCPDVTEAVADSRPCPEIEHLTFRAPIRPDEVFVTCWFCPACIAALHLPPTESVISNEFMSRISHLYRPVCTTCFDEWQWSQGQRFAAQASS